MTAMNAATVRPAVPAPGSAALLVMHVDGDACPVRATSVWPIAEVLEFDGEFADFVAAGDGIDTRLVVDAIESRMIATPRLRRRQRAVSSRAAFYAGG